MYFPYFRGRQYELLALKELAHNNLISNFIIPIVEPIKISTTLNNALQTFNHRSLPISIVFNPTVGELQGEVGNIEKLCENLNNNQFFPLLIMNKDVLTYLENMPHAPDKILILLTDRDSVDDYKRIFSSSQPKYTLIPDERQFKRTVNQGKILFENKFNKKIKNSDYPTDEFFSEDHLYYSDEGYDGFGDYSIIGNEYNENGFAPYAVAIHIVYFAKDRTLRVQHFLSDANFDISDVAGKFYEAVTKLTSWAENIHKSQYTQGLEILLNHYKNRTYPGLPTLKKLSIMHHLELINKYLKNEIYHE